MFESRAFKPNDKLNWGCKIRDILCKYGFNHARLSQNVVNEDIFMLEFKQRVIDAFLNEAISFFDESPTFNTLFQKDKCNVSIFTPLWKPHTSHP
jgi:hypothetical protein